MGFIQEGSRQIVYKRLESIKAPEDFSHFEDWRERVSKQLNAVTRMLGGSIDSGGSSMICDTFTGDGATFEFTLTHKVKQDESGNYAAAIVLTPSGQKPLTSWAFQPLNDVQDKIVFSWLVRDLQVILVYYQPAN